MCTDTIFAEYYARFLAHELGAALLPTMPIASSLEHSAFRGSLSLRPETLMQIVRDIVDQLMRQRFTRLVIVNGHGGNFFLPPVVRDINSRNLAIRIILTDCDDGLIVEGANVHSDKYEISQLMALAPELVRSEEHATGGSTNGVPPKEGFMRSDLNLYGIGTRHPSGVWGDDRGGSAEIGEKMIALTKKNLLHRVKERLAWLDENETY